MKGCCPEGSWPALKVDYKPEPEKLQIAGTPVYHFGKGDKVLIIVSDIFGATSGRHFSVAQTYSKFGYNVFLPEILVQPYQGAMQMGPIIASIKSQNWQVMEGRFKGLHQYLSSKGHKKFFCIGFCWGVWAAFKFSAKYQGFISIVGMHPSLGVAGMFGESEVQLTKSVQCPAYFCPAGNDPANVKPGGELVEILKDRFGVQKTGTTEFPDMVHGWVVRSDVSEEKNCKDVELAIKISEEYFAKF